MLAGRRGGDDRRRPRRRGAGEAPRPAREAALREPRPGARGAAARWRSFAVFVVSGLASFVSGYSTQWVAQKVILDLRRAMFAKVLRLPPAFLRRSGHGVARHQVHQRREQPLRGIDQRAHGAGARHGHDRGAHGDPALVELEAHADHLRRDPADRRRGARVQPAPARHEPRDAARHGRRGRSARRVDREPARGARLRRPGLREQALREREPAHPPLQHEAGGRRRGHGAGDAALRRVRHRRHHLLRGGAGARRARPTWATSSSSSRPRACCCSR